MIIVRELVEKDIIPLAELLAKKFPHAVEKGFPYTTKEFWLSLFEVWWTTNPAYTDTFPRGWVLENDTALVGFIGNIPVKFLIFGEVKIAAASNGWLVDPSFRGLFSLKLFNEFIKQKSASLFLFKIEDESFRFFLSKYKFEHYILPKSQKEFAYIINKRKLDYIFLKFILNNRMPKLYEFLELYKRLGFLITAYLYQKPVIQGGVLPGKEYTSSACTFCDDSFSKIWDQYQDRYDVTISRDTKTLNWLYFSSSRFRKRVVIQCHHYPDKNLAGYMVFDVQRIKTTDEATMQLMDMCIADNDPKVLESLTSYAIEIGKQNGASLLLVWGNSQETETYFRRTFTLRRTAQYHRYIRFPDIHEMNLSRENYDKVSPTMIYPPQ